MATEPKFRPSLTAAELAAIELALPLLINSDSMSVTTKLAASKTLKSIQLFNFKISNQHTQASYIPTGTGKPQVTPEDLLSESELAEQMGLKGGIDYSSTTAMHTAYKNCMLAKSLGANPTMEDQVAAEKWVIHCDQNNLSYDTGEEKS